MLTRNVEKFLSNGVYNSNSINNKIVRYINHKFKDKLKNYTYITDIQDLSCGGYIRYVDLNISKIKYGILSKITKNKYDNVILVLKNTQLKYHWKILFSKY